MTNTGADPIYGVAIGAGRTLFGALRLKSSLSGAKNLPATGGAVLAITHFGYFDFALVEWMMWKRNRRHIRFLATKGAFDKPVVGSLLRGMRHISVDMSAGADAFRLAVEALKAGEVLGVFPEGGVSASFTVRELKTGAIRMAAEAGVPVVPVAVWGGHRLMTKGPKTPLREKFGLPVGFAVGDPIVVGAGDDPAALTLTLRERLQALVSSLQDRYPDDGAGAWWQPADRGGAAPTPEVSAIEETARKQRKAAKKAAEAAQRAARRK
jgi:1-acyl-sn-glycerol-3-phosphate acyltransferase